MEAKREASRIAKLQRAKEKNAKKNATRNGQRAWLGDEEEWEVSVHNFFFYLFLSIFAILSLNVKIR